MLKKNLDVKLYIRSAIKNQGRQGKVVILTNGFKGKDELTCVCKISIYPDFSIRHEYTILKSLMEISAWCPYFCKVYKLSNECSNITRGEILKVCNEDLPSTNTSTDFLFIEHVENSRKLHTHIKSHRDINIIWTSIRHVLMALVLSARLHFTHNDLHSSNILMRPCNPALTFLYKVNNKHFLIPTHGYIPIIIDTGFSFIKNVHGKPYYLTSDHTEKGFITHEHVWWSDAKVFLSSVTKELEYYHTDNQDIKSFSNKVHKLWKKIPINRETGWDCIDSRNLSFADYVTEYLYSHGHNSVLIYNRPKYFFEILQSLVILPLEDQELEKKNVEIYFQTFLSQWNHIEKQTQNIDVLQDIFKYMVDLARSHHSDYVSTPTRNYAIARFKHKMLDFIDKIINYFSGIDIKWELMLCGLLCLGRGIEGLLWDCKKDMDVTLNNINKIIPYDNIFEIWEYVNKSIPKLKPIFSKDTILIICDSDNGSNTTVTNLTKEDLTFIHSYSKESTCATALYNKFRK